MQTPSVDELLTRAHSSGEAWQANQLIHDTRAKWAARYGQAANYEIVATGRTFGYLEREVAPRLAFYLRSKRYSVGDCAPVFLSIFRGDRLYFLGAQNFFEYLREARGYSKGGFAALVSVWERTGQGAVALLTGGEQRMNTSDVESRCGALIIGGFEGLSPPTELLERIARGHLGGVILFKRNIADLAQVRELCRELLAAQAPDAPPLFIAIDQEGGRVQRIRAPLPAWPPMKLLGVLDDVDLTWRVGRAIGTDLRALGIDLNFAPVLDVVDNAANTVIGDRSFGSEPDLVARHGVALAQGLGDVGILACGKHFPGHGGPVADSHYGLARDCRTQLELERADLRPFIRAIAAGVPLMMAAHVSYPTVVGDEAPATFSGVLCTKILRDVLGFSGVLCSDDLEMGAITECCSVAEAGLRAVRAGIDILLVCHQRDRQEALRLALVEALRADEALRSSVELALERVERLHRKRQVVVATGPLPPSPASLRCFEELRTRAAMVTS